MLHSPISPDTQELSQRIAAAAVEGDTVEFPAAPFAVLRDAGFAARPPIGRGQMPELLRLLVAVGRGDLSTGRIFEGHLNACWLIATFGSGRQQAALVDSLDAGGLLGVWNTDAPDAPLRLEGDTLIGMKNYASGVDGLSHAIVTVTNDQGRKMLLVPLANLPVDRSWWQPVGMKASGSHIVDFTGLRVSDDNFIGNADDYIGQPWFSAGAVRFLAVQLGGVHSIFDIARTHLGKTGRADNPYQAHRLARMGAAVETGYLWLERLGQGWLAAERDADPATAAYLMAGVNGARLAIEQLALEVLTLAEQAIGAAGMIAPHPFERQMRDLRTYLRQPNPDGAAAHFGASIAHGSWTPGQLIHEKHGK